jgi:YD repeat-containing protein
VTNVSAKASAAEHPRPTSYEHDEAGSITRIVDPLGGMTTQTLDALGRLASRALPNGFTSTYDTRDDWALLDVGVAGLDQFVRGVLARLPATGWTFAARPLTRRGPGAHGN